MDCDNSGANMFSSGPEAENRGSEACDGSCRKEIAKLQAEINAMKSSLDICHTNDVPQETQSTEREATEEMRVLDENDVEAGSGAKEVVTHPALLNDLVIRKLASYLTVEDLLECRVVCKTWNATVSVTLQTRSTYLKKKIKDIKHLISSMERNPQFPFPGFQLADSMFHGQLEQPMKKLLSKCSHVFKRLRLPYSFVNFGFATKLSRMLSTYFSKVKVLDMSPLICSSDTPMTDRELMRLCADLAQLSLPSLKKLILPSSPEEDDGLDVLVRDIITAAPNLECIEDFVPGLSMGVGSSEKINLVSTMIFEDYDRLEPFIAVTWKPPCQLSHFEMEEILSWDDDSDELQEVRLNAFTTVLKASSETLTSLTIRDLGSQLKYLPVFPKLRSLHVIGDAEKCSETYRLFPGNVSSIFPSLSSVTIEIEDYPTGQVVAVATAEPLKFFLWDEPLPSVTSLKVRFGLEKHGIMFLGKIFPNVTQLFVDWETCVGEDDGEEYRLRNFWDVWTVPFKLHRLEIHQFNPWAHADFSLDSFLTGIPENVCRNLRQQKYAEKPINAFYFDALRGYPSLLNLEDTLKELKISIIYHPTAVGQLELKTSAGTRQQVVSPVSNLYAIKLMKDMCVYVAYDHRKSYSSTFKKVLAPIAGNVTVCHEAYPMPTESYDYD